LLNHPSWPQTWDSTQSSESLGFFKKPFLLSYNSPTIKFILQWLSIFTKLHIITT
jgi:hypothetical protein